MNSFVYFPFEIIDQINSYLSDKDRYELVNINRTFHKVFTRLLYQRITITTYQQYKQLVTLFTSTQYTSLPLGRCVHHLKVLLDQLSEEELRTIQRLCPALRSIHIDWRIWNYLGFVYQNKLTTSSSLITRNYLPRSLLPPFTTEFIAHYGASTLSSLTLDLHNTIHIDGRDILSYTPHLRNLTLMGINQYDNITFEFVESIHQSCPLLEDLTLEGDRSEIDDFSLIWRRGSPDASSAIYPRMKSFKLQCQYGAERYQDWLPYFSLKYPNLLSLHFYHSGTGKDIIEPCPPEIYRDFIKSCPRLMDIRWHQISPDFEFFHELDKAKHQRLKVLDLCDTIPMPSLLLTLLFESRNHIFCHLTAFTFGPLPRDTTPHELIESIANACPQLKELGLREPHCNLKTPFKIDIILSHCRNLVKLELDHIALRVSFNNNNNNNSRLLTTTTTTTAFYHHPLQSLIMHHCSSFDGVFEYISPRCPNLNYLSLFAYTQRDRRYKVQIHLPHQRLKKIELHALRTESYDEERRIRFFSIHQRPSLKWYFMNEFDISNQQEMVETRYGYRHDHYRHMELAKEWVTLNTSEVEFLQSLLSKPIPWSEVERRKRAYLDVMEHSNLVAQWDPKDIYDAGYVDLVCDSIDQLCINKKYIYFK
ncbi:uncharacterized protein BX663DRAFT_501252 [Cokeromyces recurvatus]|uniref:uncharacterized protein n=1 Tax=Cokeromyces recurvatus TaxID=90255 RepID=UPI00221F70E1|nr:uncharacterized protein BX663DRAFT_501252 [Cokeromyces recurvatus]KAI7904979.1 hypothetical protein BX663DRAFT_501252 [Cokeromyces recurvatus]